MFREKIKIAMGMRNLKTNYVARACGITQTSLSSFLSGQRGIKYEQLERLVEFLGLTLVVKERFRFHSDFMEKQEKEREAKFL